MPIFSAIPTRMDRKRSSAGLLLLLLPAVVWLFYNTTVNRHIHICADGFVISHSHPFTKGQADSDPSRTHQHTDKELMLLSLFSDPVATIIFLFFLLPFIQAYPRNISFQDTSQEPVRKYFQVHNYHAPPFPC